MSAVPFEVPDHINQPVAVGDWIAYGVGRGYISTALVIEIRERGTRDSYEYSPDGKWVNTPVPLIKLVVKSPDNSTPSHLEAYRKHFIKIPARPEGTEKGIRS